MNLLAEDISPLSIMTLDVMDEQPAISDELSGALTESKSHQAQQALYVC